jgi:hypothetical protein
MIPKGCTHLGRRAPKNAAGERVATRSKCSRKHFIRSQCSELLNDNTVRVVHMPQCNVDEIRLKATPIKVSQSAVHISFSMRSA